MLPPLKQREINSRHREVVAYDLETTRIKAGTPTPLYITAFGKEIRLSVSIGGGNPLQALCNILEAHLLIEENNATRFVAWYGNQFDVYIIAQALLLSDKWIMRPYLTSSKNLRGLKIVEDTKRKKKLMFEFLDGAAMTGLNTAGMALKRFISLFAPHLPKLTLDFSKVEFDAKNKDHVEYAERDSEGLYYAFKEANRIVKELSGNDFQPTIGNLAIKYFQKMMPEENDDGDELMVWAPPFELQDTLYNTIMRGGYCWIQRQFDGRVWKYDINQAYAAAMRECALPAGRCVHTVEYMSEKCGVYHVYIGRGVESLIPFYYRSTDKNIGAFTCGAFVDTWITSIELEHLARDGWQVDIVDGFYWEEHFSMRKMVDELERLRFTDPNGPSGPLGTIVKCVGNNAYGKTLERLEGLELVIASDCPDGYSLYQAENEAMDCVFFRMVDAQKRNYHQPQIGAFITAYVRILVREAALLAPDHFLYADTDSVTFSCSVDEHLDVDPRRYGAWKKEADGARAQIIGKKVYFLEDDEHTEKKAKGLAVNRETVFIDKHGKKETRKIRKADFEMWMAGRPPKQQQVMRNNFIKHIGGEDMFKDQIRHGTDVTRSDYSYLDDDGFFHPISY